MSQRTSKRRVLIIDDLEAIHSDFRRVLCPSRSVNQERLEHLEGTIFGEDSAPVQPSGPEFEVDSAYQGDEGVAKVQEAMAEGRPYSLVFLDYRMPGWNGAATLRQLRKVAPSQQVVIFSAYSDYSWEEIIQEFGKSRTLSELRKPFNSQQLRLLVMALTEPDDPSEES